MLQIAGPGFNVSVPDNWRDITDSLEGDDCPFTLAIPEDGVGALQFSAALYRSGEVPAPTIDDLHDLLHEFAERQSLGLPIEQSNFVDDLLGATASFHADTDFVAVWYLSDGMNFMLVTYVSEWNDRHVEAAARDAIVQSIQFCPPVS